MNYNIIINPITNRKVRVSTPLGQKIIKNYGNILMGGAFFGQAEKPKINPNILKKLQKQHLAQRRHGDCLLSWKTRDTQKNPFNILQCMKDYYCESFNKGQGKLSKSEKTRLDSYIRYVASFDPMINDKDLMKMKSIRERHIVCDKLQFTIDKLIEQNKVEMTDKSIRETLEISQKKLNKLKNLISDLVVTNINRPIFELITKILLTIVIVLDEPKLSKQALKSGQFGGSSKEDDTITIKEIVNSIYDLVVSRHTLNLGLSIGALFMTGGTSSILNAFSSFANAFTEIGPIYALIDRATSPYFQSWDFFSGIKSLFSRFSVASIMTIIIGLISWSLANLESPLIESQMEKYTDWKPEDVEKLTGQSFTTVITLVIMTLIYNLLFYLKGFLWKISALPKILEYEDSDYDRIKGKLWKKTMKFLKDDDSTRYTQLMKFYKENNPSKATKTEINKILNNIGSGKKYKTYEELKQRLLQKYKITDYTW
uniref:Uncharacterized protein n=1 Tax=viral metagenome TaxID=1070528 RepID=A0A6C0J1N2_9ZZZZ